MPNYNYSCPSCEQEMTVTKSMGDSGREENCPECKIIMSRIYSLSEPLPDMEPYWDEHLGYVRSGRHREELMKERGVRDGAGDNERRIIEQKKAHREELFKNGWKKDAIPKWLSIEKPLR